MLNFLLFLLLFPSSSSSDININIDGIEELKGSMFIAVFDDPASFPEFGKQYREMVIPVRSLELSHTFKDLPNHTYAVAVFHDINDNGILDKNALGIPLEPYGFSRNARARCSAPPFEDAKIEFIYNLEIHLNIQ